MERDTLKERMDTVTIKELKKVYLEALKEKEERTTSYGAPVPEKADRMSMTFKRLYKIWEVSSGQYRKSSRGLSWYSDLHYVKRILAEEGPNVQIHVYELYSPYQLIVKGEEWEDDDSERES